MIKKMNFKKLLDESSEVHGHLCPRQVLGVRMAMYGMDLVGICDPKGADRKKLYLFVEIDRCATDALQSVTGCSLGRRTMRFMDYGKMAATFVNLETDQAVRVVAKEESKFKAKQYIPEIEDKSKCQLEAYKIMSDEELFSFEEVRTHILPPGYAWETPETRDVCKLPRACSGHAGSLQERQIPVQTLCERRTLFSYSPSCKEARTLYIE